MLQCHKFLCHSMKLSKMTKGSSPFTPSCQNPPHFKRSTLKEQGKEAGTGGGEGDSVSYEEQQHQQQQQDETFCRSQCVAQHVRSLLQQNSDNNKMQSCMYRHFMKDTKGKELKHNAVETSGRLASYYYFSTSQYVVLLQSPFFSKVAWRNEKNIVA